MQESNKQSGSEVEQQTASHYLRPILIAALFFIASFGAIFAAERYFGEPPVYQDGSPAPSPSIRPGRPSPTPVPEDRSGSCNDLYDGSECIRSETMSWYYVRDQGICARSEYRCGEGGFDSKAACEQVCLEKYQ